MDEEVKTFVFPFVTVIPLLESVSLVPLSFEALLLVILLADLALSARSLLPVKGVTTAVAEVEVVIVAVVALPSWIILETGADVSGTLSWLEKTPTNMSIDTDSMDTKIICALLIRTMSFMYESNDENCAGRYEEDTDDEVGGKREEC